MATPYRSLISFSYSASDCLRMMVSFPENTNGLEGSVTRIISLNTRAKVGDDSFTSSTTGLIRHMSKLNVGSSEALPDNVTKFR